MNVQCYHRSLHLHPVRSCNIVHLQAARGSRCTLRRLYAIINIYNCTTFRYNLQPCNSVVLTVYNIRTVSPYLERTMEERLYMCRLWLSKGATRYRPPGLKGRQPGGITPVIHKLCAKLAFTEGSLNTPRRTFSTHSLFKTQTQKTADAYYGVVRY